MSFEKGNIPKSESIRKLKEQKIESLRKFHQCVSYYILPEVKELEKNLIEMGYKPELNIERALNVSGNLDESEKFIKGVRLKFIPKKNVSIKISKKVFYIQVYDTYTDTGNDERRIVFEAKSNRISQKIIGEKSYAIEEVNQRLAKEILSDFFEKTFNKYNDTVMAY